MMLLKVLGFAFFLGLSQWTTCSSGADGTDVNLSRDVSEERNDYSIYCSVALQNSKVKCTDKDEALLPLGYCMTHEDGVGIFLAQCPDYFQLEGHNVTESGYIKLPNNISQLNDYMCGPMNRKGLLCEDCIDGFGPSVTSIGYKCSNCSDAWYGVPLYLLLEFVPITVLLLVFLIFQFHITSAPMTCFVMYSQFIMFQLIFHQRYPVMPQNMSSPLFKLTAIFYGIWNLDILRYSVPSFCISSRLQIIHVVLLGYISAFYPLILIFLIWLCIKLHGYNFKPLVWLWRPFHECFFKLQKRLATQSDITNIFASFIYLSHGKLLYQMSILFQCTTVGKLSLSEPTYRDWSENDVMFNDKSVSCGATQYFLLAIPGLLVLLVFNILPALLLVFYPFKRFRACLTKCRLDESNIVTFVGKFHDCYEDGFDGGRDTRSFSGLYFFLPLLSSIYFPLQFHKLNFIPIWSYWTLLYLTAVVLIAFVQPYKHSYMNISDIFLLMYLTILCHFLSRNYKPAVLLALFLAPAFAFGLFLLLKICLKLKKKFNHSSKSTTEGHAVAVMNTDDSASTPANIRPTPELTRSTTVTIIDIKSYGSDESHTS